MEQIRRRLTYANVMSTIAVFVALGGATTLAANQLAEKSVGERQLRPGAVTASKLRKNAVTAPKIKALAVKSGKLASGSVRVNKIASGAVSGDKIAGGAVSGDKIANDAVTGDKVVESSLSEVPSANKANSAAFATSANPVAFAAVDQEGNVDTSLSRGITSANVKEGSEPGIYCISVPGFNPRGAQVTARYNNTGGVTAYVKVGGSGDCPSPQVEVQTYSGLTRLKEPFYIVLYQ